MIASGEIEEVTINVKDSSLDVKETKAEGGESFSTGYPPNTEPSLLKVLEEGEANGGLRRTKVHGTAGSSFLSLLTYSFPFFSFSGSWIFLRNRRQGGGSRVMNF